MCLLPDTKISIRIFCLHFIGAAIVPRDNIFDRRFPVQIKRGRVEKIWEVIDGAEHGNFAIRSSLKHCEISKQ